MLRRIVKSTLYFVYVVSVAATISYVAIISKDVNNYFLLVFVALQLLGFILSNVELYLLKRSSVFQNDSVDIGKTGVYVFVDNESLETLRISFLSIKNIRGNQKVFVTSKSERDDLGYLCDEFDFEYCGVNLNVDQDLDSVLITNGHTIVYPDCLLVAERRFNSNVSFVELNHNAYTAHALGVSEKRSDPSKADILAGMNENNSVPVYTGGPIVANVKKCHFEENSFEKGNNEFALAVAHAISQGKSGTITSHPCCECMSSNEIENNISSRFNRLSVSRNLKRHPQYVDTMTGIFKRYLGWYYTKLYWLRSIIISILALALVIACIVGIPDKSQLFALGIAVFISNCSIYFLSNLSGDQRKFLDRVRDSILEMEALAHHALSKLRIKTEKTNLRIRFVPFYFLVLCAALLFRFWRVVNDLIFTTEVPWADIALVCIVSFVLLSLYSAMSEYLSARQRSFARRSVSITGSSSYESMWIVDLTHRGAAYLTEVPFDLGDETPLVFRIPTMKGDSLITVVGKVTYCGKREGGYQVGVAFKELSQNDLDDLILFCSVIFPYHKARNIDDSESISTERPFQIKEVSKRPKNLLSLSLYALVLLVIIGISFSSLPTLEKNELDSSLVKRSGGSFEVISLRDNFSSNSSIYDFETLGQSDDENREQVTVGSSVYFDSNNDGVKDQSEAPLNGASIEIFSAGGKQLYQNQQGEFSFTENNGNSRFSYDGQGNLTLRSIPTGKYYVNLVNSDGSVHPNNLTINRSGLTRSSKGFRSDIFEVDTQNSGNIEALSFGFNVKSDLEVFPEIINPPKNGFVSGDTVNVRVSVRNSGFGVAKRGFVLSAKLGDEFNKNSLVLNNSGVFRPCGFNELELQCTGAVELKPGEVSSVEFSVVSSISSTSSSTRRLIDAKVIAAKDDDSEIGSSISNNSMKIVLPVGKFSSVGDQVFLDRNGNGTQDVGENGVSGIRVGLREFRDINGDGIKDPGETPEIANDVSDVNGYFGTSSGRSGFQNLTPGSSYALTFSSIPNNFEVTNAKKNEEQQWETSFVPVGENEVNVNFDLGLKPKLENVKVKLSLNQESSKKKEELLNQLSGIESRIYEVSELNVSQQNPIAIGLSDGTGELIFEPIEVTGDQSRYKVEIDLPQGLKISRSLLGGSTSKNTFRVVTKELTARRLASLNIKLQETGSTVEGKLLVDFNNDARPDEKEGAPKNIRVTLVSEDGTTKTVKTNSYGEYSFKDVKSGSYMLGFPKGDLPHGFILGGIGKNEIKKDLFGRKEKLVKVDLNSQVRIRNIFLVADSQLSGRVYDFAKDVGRPRLISNAGVTISDGPEVISSTKSDSIGRYEFNDLIGGEKTIDFNVSGNIRSLETDLVAGENVIDSENVVSPKEFDLYSLFKGQNPIRYSDSESLSNVLKILLVIGISLIFLIFAILFRRKKLIYRASE